MAKMQTGFIYCRTSTDTQVEKGHGLDVQLKLCQDFCKEQRIQVEGIFKDEGVSGASMEKREQLEKMLSNLNGVDYVIVSATSRLWRDMFPQALITKALKDAKKDVRAVDEPSFTIYTKDDPNQFLINGIMGVLDSWERLPIAKRLKRGRRQKASTGIKAAGSAPFGYRWSEQILDGKKQKAIETDPNEALVVKQMFNGIVRLRNVTRLKKELEREGIVNKRGNAWTRQALDHLLRNDFYTGKVRHGQGLKVQGQHEAIISPVVFGKAQSALWKARTEG